MKLLWCIDGLLEFEKIIEIGKVIKNNYKVEIILSESYANNFSPIKLSRSLDCLTIVSTRNCEGYIYEEIKKLSVCDVFFLAPASASSISKMANGFSDDLISSVHLLLNKGIQKKICPVMHKNVYENKFVKYNIGVLKDHWYHFLEPAIEIDECVLPKLDLIYEFLNLNKDKINEKN